MAISLIQQPNMKPGFLTKLNLIALSFTSIQWSNAQSGTWTSSASGLWSEAANWSDSTVADGSDSIASFSTLDLSSSITVSLDTPRTLSEITFGDTNPLTSGSWIVNNNGVTDNVLTLDGTSLVTVNALGTGASAEISAIIAGNSGLSKVGPGTLVLSGANTYTGTTYVDEGKLTLGFARPSATYLLSTGTSLEFANASNLNIPGGTISGTGTLVKSGNGNLGLGFSNYQAVNVTLDADSLVHIKGGTIAGSSYGQGQWGSNLSDLQIDSGATFDSSENDATFDAVTGGGNLIGTWWGDPATINVGVANGTGTFTGRFFQNKNTPLALTKKGSGTQTFSGEASHSGTTSVEGGRLVLSGLSNSALYTLSNDSALEINRITDQNHNIKNVLINGTGKFIKSGAGLLMVNRYQGEADRSYEMALSAGSEFRVEGGRMRLGDYNINWNFANNLSSLHIATGATLDADATNVVVDSLTGGGVYEGGRYGARSLTVGVNGGSGTFSGNIQSNGWDGQNQVVIVKRGNGTQSFTGKVNARGMYGGSSVEVRGGIIGSPSILNLSPTDPASITGYTGGGIYISPGGSDVTEFNQTAGTLVGSLIAVGEYGKATYNLSGGTVNAGRLEFAWNGGGNNGAAVMNISGSAAMNINSNGNILMGQYWGRPITVNQSGGSVIQFSDAGVTRGGTGLMRFLSSNQNVSWNLTGGTLSIAGMERASGSGFGGGNGVLNLNGGIFQITNAAFAAPTGVANGKPVFAANVLGNKSTPNSGARIDNYGLNVTFAAPVLHGSVDDFDGGLVLNSSVAGGSLTLSGINTYTGDTSVASGNSFVLADNAELSFLVKGLNSTRVTGAGSASFQGDFRIDTGAAATTSGSSWTLVDVASSTYASSFQIIGFTEVGNLWTKIDGANTWSFNKSTGVLTLTVASPSGYGSWIDDFTVSDASEGADPDFDGMENLLEFVLNGNPSVSDSSILPTLNASGESFVFTFTRRTDSVSEVVQSFEYGSNLSGWTSIAIAAGAQVVIGESQGGVETVTITIPKSAAVDGRLFGRLKVTK